VASFGRPARESDVIFILNAPQPNDVLWARDRLEARTGSLYPRVAVLSDVCNPTVERIRSTQIRLTAKGEPFLSSFIGRMGRVRGTKIEPGKRVDMGEYAVTASRAKGEALTELTIDFAYPVDWDGYRFFNLSLFFPPEAVRFTTTHPAR